MSGNKMSGNEMSGNEVPASDAAKPQALRPKRALPNDPSTWDGTPPMGFPDAPGVRRIGASEIKGALADGWRDFLRAPQFGLFFGAVFVAAGLAIYFSLAEWDTPWAIIPLAIAFPLLGPFIAVGLYEVSRRISSGEPLSWGPVLSVVFRQKDRQLAWMGFVMLFVFWIWAYQVRLLLALLLGSASFSSLTGFLDVVFSTGDGLTFLAVGTAIGAALAIILFSVTVVATPLLVDRDIDIISAISTSVTAVRRSPVAMVGYGLVVTVLMIAALVPAFLGLLVVLPVLGHATWRLYERVIVQDERAFHT